MSGQPSDADARTNSETAEPTTAATPDATTAATASGATAPGHQPTPEPAASDPAADARIAELERQISDLTDRLLRAHAEMDNIRKRTERDKEDASRYAVTKFALDMVTATDNLQRAMDAAGAPDTMPKELQALYEGVALTGQELIKAFARHGIKQIAALGAPFDPHVHQAVMEKPDPSVPSGTVLQVFQAGYMIAERVLRPAMVVVARGGAKPARQPPAAEAPAANPAGTDAATEPSAEPKPGDDTDSAGSTDA